MHIVSTLVTVVSIQVYRVRNTEKEEKIRKISLVVRKW